MDTQETYELKISFANSAQGLASKSAVLQCLAANGVDSFVEGVIDGLDLDHEFGQPERDFYQEQGGDYAPILLCSFDKEYIADLHQKIAACDPHAVLEENVVATAAWQTGWKDSFQPIITDFFRICPIWEEPKPDLQRTTVFIEPGMAFGTGQHASTQLCLRLLETLVRSGFDFEKSTILDLGTGSGILAIAIAKLGAQHLWATDLDPDALLAARKNADFNQVRFAIEQGSLPATVTQKFDLIVANILFTVLAPMVDTLANALVPGAKIILSGLIEEQADAMIKLAGASGLHLTASAVSEGWIALLFHKPAS